jgi:hypothetical protein
LFREPIGRYFAFHPKPVGAEVIAVRAPVDEALTTEQAAVAVASRRAAFGEQSCYLQILGSVHPPTEGQ